MMSVAGSDLTPSDRYPPLSTPDDVGGGVGADAGLHLAGPLVRALPPAPVPRHRSLGQEGHRAHLDPLHHDW